MEEWQVTDTPGFSGVWPLEGLETCPATLCPHTVWRMLLAPPGKTYPPRPVGGGGGRLRREQLVPHPWLPPRQEQGLQQFVRLGLSCFSKSVWKPVWHNFQASHWHRCEKRWIKGFFSYWYTVPEPIIYPNEFLLRGVKYKGFSCVKRSPLGCNSSTIP